MSGVSGCVVTGSRCCGAHVRRGRPHAHGIVGFQHKIASTARDRTSSNLESGKVDAYFDWILQGQKLTVGG